MRGELVDGTEAQLRSVLARLSAENREELDALGNDEGALGAFQSSVRCWCGMVGGMPMLFAGITSEGVAWMLTTDDWRRARKFYLRATRQIVDEMQAIFPVVLTAEDADRRRELRWLEWLGFTLKPGEFNGRAVCWAERTAT